MKNVKNKIPGRNLTRSLYGSIRLANYRHELIPRSHTVNGVQIRSYEPLNAHRRVDEEELLMRLSEEVSDGEVVYDIGANVGTHSLVLANKYDVTIKCFEPNPNVYRWLVANIRANDCEKIEPFLLGLSDHDGISELHLAHRQSSVEVETEEPDSVAEIQIARLDTFVGDGLSPPDRLKIDVEGHGPSVLEGSRTTLRDHEPTVHIEPHSNVAAIRSFFDDIDYFIDQYQTHLIARPAGETDDI